MRRVTVRWIGTLVLLAFFGGTAFGCPVCYGAADSKILDGLNASIIFLLALTYVLVGGFIAFFIVLRYRNRMARLQSGDHAAHPKPVSQKLRDLQPESVH